MITESKTDRHIYTVTEITRDIKLILESTFAQVWVEGEISNFRPAASGHYYFSLKDENAVLSSAIFKGSSRIQKFKIEDGLKVICFGTIEVYAPHGKYQLIIERIEPKGLGSLQLALEQLKRSLEKEGLFSPEHKRPIPHLPSKIGVVTSLHGAAVKDILKVLARRFKDVQVVINPVKVQGEGAREEIAQGIMDFNVFNASVPPEQRIDVLIVGRGGGSIEDLWAFNEEIVARAIYNSKIPVISAVGHERDVTIADLVADVRAATPSQAAELVIPEKEELSARVRELTDDLANALFEYARQMQETFLGFLHRLRISIGHNIALQESAFFSASKKLHLVSPLAHIQNYQARLGAVTTLIQARMRHLFTLRQAEFVRHAEKLANLSPLAILARGYSITFAFSESRIIKDAAALSRDDIIRTKFAKGEVISRVTEVTANGGN